MQSVLIVIHILIVIALVAVVLLQRSEGGVLGSGGGSGNFMTGRGQANALSRATAVLATLFFATSILMSILAGWSRTPHSILQGTGRAGQPAGAPAGQPGQHPRSAEAASGPVQRALGAAGPGRARAGREALAGAARRPPERWGMPSFRNERRVRHRSDQMFDLVADVERYPEFVPLCKELRVRSRRPDAQGRETLVAEMSVGYKMIRETFTSRVLLDKPRLRVVVEYIDGPFSHLENIWTFRDEPGPQGSRRQLFHRLRIPQPHARRADGRDVRPGFPQIRGRVRRAGGRSLPGDAVGAGGRRGVPAAVWKARRTRPGPTEK